MTSEARLVSNAAFEDLARGVAQHTTRGVEAILRSVRSHLDMDVAFVSEFVGPRRYFRFVDSKTDRTPIHAGDSASLTDGYCQRVIDGRLPELIVDAAQVPEAAALPETHAIPIGSHISVPLRLKDGRLYGTFCCLSFNPDHSLNERDLHFMRAFAEVAAHQIELELETKLLRQEKIDRIQSALAANEPSIVYQPLIDLVGGRGPVGIECLARFSALPARPPDHWFAEADEVSLGTELELQAIGNALRALAAHPLRHDLCVWLNLSARTVIHGDLATHLEGFAIDHIVLELTEHDYVADYAALTRALDPLRARGVKVAIDDAGAGYSSMAHILNIAPDYIKLDISLTRQIDTDRKRRALAAALIEFGRQTDCAIVAEGIETEAELRALRALGARIGQGYFVGDAVPFEELGGLLSALEEGRTA